MNALRQCGFIVHLTQDYASYFFDAVKILMHTAYIILYTVYDKKHSICFVSLRTLCARSLLPRESDQSIDPILETSSVVYLNIPQHNVLISLNILCGKALSILYYVFG